MKKTKKTVAILTLAIATTAGYFGYAAHSETTMTDAERMMQANLEALTDAEYELLNQGPAQLIECPQSSSISIGKYCMGEKDGGACIDIPCNNDRGSGDVIYTNI